MIVGMLQQEWIWLHSQCKMTQIINKLSAEEIEIVDTREIRKRILKSNLLAQKARIELLLTEFK